MIFWKTAQKYLKINGLNISQNFIRLKMISNISYPSLKSFTDLLDELNLTYEVAHFSKDNLQEMNLPFLAYTADGNKADFEIVNGIKKLRNPNFQSRWKGIGLRINVKSSNFSGSLKELLSEKKATDFKIRLIISIMLLDCFLAVVLNRSYIVAIFLLLNLIGIFISSLLVIDDLNIYSTTYIKLCKLVNKTSSCNKKLVSKKICGNIGLADMGLIYFISLFLFLLVSTIFEPIDSVLSLLWILSFVSFSFIIYSIFYQIKNYNFCIWCISIVFLLILQFVYLSFIFKYWYNFKLSFSSIAMYSNFLILSSIWIVIKDLVFYKKKQEFAVKNFFNWQRRFEVFFVLLKEGKKYDIKLWEDDIILGSKSAVVKICVASNPFCQSCVDAYKWVKHLIEKFPNEISVVFRFILNDTNKANSQILALNNIIDAYYSSKMATEFLNTLIDGNFSSTNEYNKVPFHSDLANKYKIWIRENKIASTPTIFLNGYIIPQGYALDQVSCFLPNIIKQFSLI